MPTSRPRRISALLAACAGLGLVSLAEAQSTVAAQPRAGAASTAEVALASRHPKAPRLNVRPEHEGKGTIYHAISGKERQVVLSGQAAAERFQGHTNQVVGYLVAGPSSDPAMLVGAEWRLPVSSIRTGNRSRDEALIGADWLNAAKHPDVIVQIDKVEAASNLRSTPGATSHRVAATGRLTLRGVTRPVRIDECDITFIQACEQTAAIAKGDLVRAKAVFPIRLSDFGVSAELLGQAGGVPDDLRVEVALVLTDVPPEAAPADSAQAHQP